MKSVRSPDFRKLCENLPKDIQTLATEKYTLWKSDARYVTGANLHLSGGWGI